MTQVICIVTRLGANVGGGKLNAIFRRMNLLAHKPDTTVTLLNLTHGVNQKIAFAILQRKGVFDPKIRHQSIYEFCAHAGHSKPRSDEAQIPTYDQETRNKQGDKVSYYRNGTLVMRDTAKSTDAGQLCVRKIFGPKGTELRLKYLDDVLCESLTVHKTEKTFRKLYVDGRINAAHCVKDGEVSYALNYADRKRYRFVNNLQKSLVEHGFDDKCVVFIDGITTAYLSRHIAAKKVLFLHADHRAPNGEVVPRSRFLIENFDGDLIATATQVHKTRLQEDTRFAAPIRVIPHYAELQPFPKGNRQHICTVSRLELEGKPIHQTIEAFARIKDDIPDIDYHIYGSGLGEDTLSKLIADLRVEDRVFLKGFTTDPASVFRKSILSLAPTMTEGFGLALLESLSFGCPVVSYNVDYGPRELIKPGHNGELVSPGDIEGIAAAIFKVLRDAKRYSRNSHASVDDYTFDVYKSRYYRLIDELMGLPHQFDLSAPDMRAEIQRCLDFVPITQKARLLDAYIHQSTELGDHESVYEGFRQKLDLFPRLQRPLMRCIWLSWRFRRLEECRSYMRQFHRRFPTGYAQFVKRYPEFAELMEEKPIEIPQLV